MYEQDTVTNFDVDKHCDPRKNLHYGFIYTFADNVNHANFPQCSVQQGLKSGRNVFVDDNNKILIITKDCTHWIDITEKSTEENNKKALDILIDSINNLNTPVKNDSCFRFNQIHIYINKVVDHTLHRMSTLCFTMHDKVHFFRKLQGIEQICYLPDYSDTSTAVSYRLFVFQDIIKNPIQDEVEPWKIIHQKHYFPLVLFSPAQEYSVIMNGVIPPRAREDKNQYDTIFFY